MHVWVISDWPGVHMIRTCLFWRWYFRFSSTRATCLGKIDLPTRVGTGVQHAKHVYHGAGHLRVTEPSSMTQRSHSLGRIVQRVGNISACTGRTMLQQIQPQAWPWHTVDWRRCGRIQLIQTAGSAETFTQRHFSGFARTKASFAKFSAVEVLPGVDHNSYRAESFALLPVLTLVQSPEIFTECQSALSNCGTW